jgi:redox-sensitive bicupin YhaK (pirin superfamily)
MQSWNLREVETLAGSRSPVVLDSEEAAARVFLIRLEPGQELGEHQVREHASVLVVEGSVEVDAGDHSLQADAMTLLGFGPDERRTISSSSGARLLLFLAPWPGPGHYRGDKRAIAESR